MDEQERQGVTFLTLYGSIVRELATNPCIAQEALARRLDVTMRTVQRHLTELEREGYIRVARDNKPYTYSVAWDASLPRFPHLHLDLFRPTPDGDSE